MWYNKISICFLLIFASNFGCISTTVCPGSPVQLTAEKHPKYLLPTTYFPAGSSKISCTWNITSLTDDRIYVRVVSLDIEHSRDYLNIYGSWEPLKLTGTKVGDFVNSLGNAVKVEFVSNGNLTGRLFNLEYFTTCPDYAVNLTVGDQRQFISSPNYGNNYPVNLTCEWILLEPNPGFIRLEMLDLQVIATDSLEMYDGESLHDAYTGIVTDTVLGIFTNYIRLKFQTQPYRSYVGFKLEYMKVCTGSEILVSANASVQSISSNNYPFRYPYTLNYDCRWRIVALSNERIHMRVVSFSTYLNHDFLTISDGVDSSQYSSKLESFLRHSSTGQFNVLFQTVSGAEDLGFKLEFFTTCPNVTQQLVAEEYVRDVFSPNYPDYNTGNRNCTWEIMAEGENRIYLVVKSLHLENNSLIIYDNKSLLDLNWRIGCQGNPTSNANGCYLYSVSNSLTILFKDESSSTSSSIFHFIYFKVCPVDTVMLTAANNTQYIRSPNYGHFYPGYLSCLWKIVTSSSSADSRIHIVVTAHDLGVNSSLKIYDGENLATTLVGSSSNVQVLLKHQYTMVQFTTTQPGSNNVCPNYTVQLMSLEVEKEIFSPNYPNMYPPNLTCHWNITAPAGKRIHFQTVQIDLENGKDFLDITNGPEFWYSLTGSTTVASPTSADYSEITFTTDGETLQNAFHLKYFTTCKSGDVQLYADNKKRFIHSRNYPARNAYSEYCNWNINPSLATDTIHVTANIFAATSSSVEIYSGNSLLGTFTDEQANYAFSTSQTHRVTSVVQFQGIDPFVGFQQVYYTSDECEPSPCLNNGTCVDLANDYNCSCLLGYVGKNCKKDFCQPNPCYNNGTCIDGPQDYSCSCVLGFTSKNCSVNINECATNSCANNGTCIDLINDHRCACSPGYTNADCSVNIDECGSNPCVNLATCEDLINDYSCTCVQGYTDKNCSTDIDDCKSRPCDNNANCSDLVNDFLCDCVAGYTGKNCSQDIDDCASKPCLQNSTCMDQLNDFECFCEPGYTGKNCSIDINECSTKPCTNDGNCTDLVNDFKCTCVAGFTSKNCSTNIDECLMGFCSNESTCHDGINDYSCECNPGFEDKNCSTNINECARQPCHNGTCEDLVSDYLCHCAEGFQGKNCSTDIDDCAPSPCKNNGTCTDLVANFTCVCQVGFTGKNCSIDIDDCASGPCTFNSSCGDLVNDYQCTCLPGYTGKNCSQEKQSCKSLPCFNNATCVDLFNHYECQCLPGFTDENCSTDIHECASTPCLHNGKCEDMVNSYKCNCPEYYKGEHCEQVPPACANVRCVKRATCFPVIGAEPECRCNDRYEGNGFELCQPFCESKALWDLNTGKFYHFERSSFLQAPASIERCKNGTGRPIASAVCNFEKGNRDDFAVLTNLRVLLCDVNFQDASQINQSTVTTETASNALTDLKLLTSVPALEIGEVDQVSNVVLSLSKTNPNKVEFKAGFLFNTLAVVGALTRSVAKSNETNKTGTVPMTISGVPQQVAQSFVLPTGETTIKITEKGTNDSDAVLTNESFTISTVQAKFEAQLSTRYSFVVFNSDTLFPSGENVSMVISANAGYENNSNTENTEVIIVFLNLTEQEGIYPLNDTSLLERVVRTRCVVWEDGEQRWATHGCGLVKGSFPPECRCTKFATFSMIVDSVILPSVFALAIFSYVGCSLSVLGLLFTVVLYSTVSRLRQRKPTPYLINICLCMAISNVIFMAGTGQTSSEAACYSVTALLHYFLLATWCWMTGNAINMYQQLVKVMGAPTYIFKASSVVSYLLPAIAVLITGGVSIFHHDVHHHTHDDIFSVSAYNSRHVCWLHLYSLYFGFLLPVGMMLALNFGLFVAVLKKLIFDTNEIRSSARKRESLDSFMIACTLMFSMGLTWVFGYLMIASNDVIYQSIMAWIFTILNSLQGFLICFFNCVRQKNIREMWLQPLLSWSCRSFTRSSNSSNSTSTGPSSSTQNSKLSNRSITAGLK